MDPVVRLLGERPDARHPPAVLVGVRQRRQRELPQVGGAMNAPDALPRRRQRRQDDRDHQRDDADHHQQLDEGKRAAASHGGSCQGSSGNTFARRRVNSRVT